MIVFIETGKINGRIKREGRDDHIPSWLTLFTPSTTSNREMIGSIGRIIILLNQVPNTFRELLVLWTQIMLVPICSGKGRISYG